MTNDVGKLSEISKKMNKKRVDKRRAKYVKMLWKKINKASKYGECIYNDFGHHNPDDYTYLEEYFEGKGFYVRKYHFLQRSYDLEICWGVAADKQRELDERQERIIKEQMSMEGKGDGGCPWN